MKKTILIAVLAIAAFAGTVQAQSRIHITGATAFRSASVNSINQLFIDSGSPYSRTFANTDIGGTSKSFTGSSYHAWRGTITGLGSVIVKCSWNGSVEGIRAVAVANSNNNAQYIGDGDLPAVPVTGSTQESKTYALLSSNFTQEVAQLAFSDVSVSSTPVSASSLTGGSVGVVVFAFCANKTWRDDALADNLGIQQFRALAAGGRAKASLFTGIQPVAGDATDKNGKFVYLTGRNDGSGTRTSYLSETGVGASKAINQYVNHDRGTATIDKILLTAKGGGFNFQNVATPQYASTVWGLDKDGNGGYDSGGLIAADFAKTSASTAVWSFLDADESESFDASEDSQTIAPDKLYLLSYLSVADAKTARGTTTPAAKILGYNGVRLDDLETSNAGLASTGLSPADRAKVTNGVYTPWNDQQLYHVTGDTTSATFFTKLKAALNSSTVIGVTGIPTGEMKVSRSTDGGTILPN